VEKGKEGKKGKGREERESGEGKGRVVPNVRNFLHLKLATLLSLST